MVEGQQKIMEIREVGGLYKGQCCYYTVLQRAFCNEKNEASEARREEL